MVDLSIVMLVYQRVRCLQTSPPRDSQGWPDVGRWAAQHSTNGHWEMLCNLINLRIYGDKLMCTVIYCWHYIYIYTHTTVSLFLLLSLLLSLLLLLLSLLLCNYVHVCVNPYAVRQSCANLWDHPPSWLFDKVAQTQEQNIYFLRSSIISVTNHYKPLLFSSFEMKKYHFGEWKLCSSAVPIKVT